MRFRFIFSEEEICKRASPRAISEQLVVVPRNMAEAQEIARDRA
jgi:hypothetical protein